ncbi:MAG: PQQ-binding-like beta-propeller repeat protein [Mucinivorans sp.]
MKKIVFAIILTIISFQVMAQVSGSVCDENQRPIVGAVLSDGWNCVATDAAGRFVLPSHPKARFVSLTKPAWWRTVGGAPYYIKINKGASYNFTLEKSPNEAGSNISFIHITDVESFAHKAWIDNIKEWVATHPTAFIVNTGDICYARGLATNGTLVRSPDMGTDMFYTVGNHDLVAGEYGEKMFEQYFGPAYYSFDVGAVHFMVLPMLGGDHRPSYTKQQLMRWIKNDLALKAPSTKVVMFNHDLWFTGDDLLITSGLDTIDMAQHNLIAFGYGHWHSHYAKTVAGIKTFSNSTPDKGGIDHGPSAFRVLDITPEGQITSRTRYTYINGAINSVAPARGDRLAAGIIPISVNAYRSSSPTSSVKVRLANRWIALSPRSDWNWAGEVKLEDGEYKMECHALFEDSTRLVTTVIFSVGERPTLDWCESVGSNIWMVAPVVVGERVFTATIDDDNNERAYVLALDKLSGRILWRAKTDNSLKNTIIATQDKVVACDSDGKLYCFDAATGSLIWKTKLSQGLLPHTLVGIALADGVVYAGQGDGFSAVKLTDGSILWRNNEWRGGEGTTSTIATGGDVVVASAHWNGLYAHNKLTGRLLWKMQDQDTRFRDGSPTFCGDTIFLATSRVLLKIEASTGRILKKEMCEVDFNVAAAPLVCQNVIYCSTASRGLAAFDRHTFKYLWSYNSAPAMFYSVPYAQDSQSSVESSPVLYQDMVIFGATDGNLYGVNRKDGTTAFKRSVGSPIFSTPTIVDHEIFVSDFAGNIMKLNLDNIKSTNTFK